MLFPDVLSDYLQQGGQVIGKGKENATGGLKISPAAIFQPWIKTKCKELNIKIHIVKNIIAMVYNFPCFILSLTSYRLLYTIKSKKEILLYLKYHWF